MKINRRVIAAACLVLITACLFYGGPAKAAKSPTGITVSPAFQQVSIQPGEAAHAVNFSITNNKTVPQTLNLSTADFNTLDESGGLLFVGTDPTQLQKKYGLAHWLSLPQTTVTILPKQTAVVRAAVENLPTLSSGGHYGAINLTINTSGSGSNTADSVAVKPIASELLFVTKIGGDTHRLALTNVYFSHNLLKLPSSVTLRFYNDGNTHLIPRGVVKLTAPGGKLVEQGVINDNSGIILPQTYRQYGVVLQKVGSSNAIGNYKLRVDYRFDGYDQYRSYQASFFVINILGLMIGLLIILLAAGLALLFRRRRWPKRLRRNKPKQKTEPKQS